MTVPQQGGKSSVKADLEIVLTDGECANAIGDKVVTIEMMGNTGLPGERRTKAFILAAAGYEGDADFDAFNPDGEFIDAVLGEANDFSAAFPATIVGRLVYVNVMRGNDVVDKTSKQPTGDFYREYEWGVVPEETQDTTPKPVFT
jgi:hypothetical protein